MKCLICGGDSFHAHQVCYHDIEVDGDNQFLDNVGGAEASVYECDTPYGPYVCTCCGAEYSELDDSQLIGGPTVPREQWTTFYKEKDLKKHESWVSRHIPYKVIVERCSEEIMSLYAVPMDTAKPMFFLVSSIEPKTGKLVVHIDPATPQNKELLEKLRSLRPPRRFPLSRDSS